MKRKVAFVTGASRGIGKAACLALARQGFDVVVTARTVKEGEGRVAGPSSRDLRDVGVPGSIEETARLIRTCGREALPIRLDLLDPTTIEPAVDRAIDEWGRVDVLLNNGIYQGPGLMDRFLDLTIEQMHTIFAGNVFAQTLLTQRVLPHMLRRGGGIVINMTSASARVDPPGPVGEGGWGFAYAASKAAFHRMAVLLHAEHHRDGIRAYNVDPGYTPTESMRALMGQQTDLDAAWGGISPEVTATAIAWLATAPEAEELVGKTISSARLCTERGLIVGQA
jgi:NAD(P)-dependent dehydrogenase (short-subunit alcohol dehydrogenase family)